MTLKLSSASEFEACAAMEATREVPVAEFPHRTGTHAVLLQRGSMRLKLPHVVGTDAPNLRIQKPHGMPWRPEGFPTAVDYPAMTIARLPNAVCVPGGVAFADQGSRLLSESFGAYWEPQPHHSLTMSGHGTFQLRSDAEVRKVLPGKYFYLDSQHIAHFGHFLLDNVTRLWGYKLCVDYLGITDLNIITRQVIPEVRQSLVGFGVNPELIHELSEPVACDELFVATKSLQIQDYTTPLTTPIFRRIRDGLSKNYDFPKKIYISRRTSPLRPLTNEDQVENIFSQRGFSVIHPSDFGSYEAQVSAFAAAKYVAGPSGTNMYCMAFQREMNGAFILTSPALVHYAEGFLQEGHRTQLSIYLGELDATHPMFDPNNVNSPWRVRQLEDLACEVDRWLERS